MDILELFKAITDGKKLAIIAGAGISISQPSNLLSGGEFINSFLNVLAPDLKTREILGRLCLNNRFEKRSKGDYLRFESLMQLISDDIDSELNILNCLDSCNSPNLNHYVLALLIKQGHKVFTTNFDNLIEIACETLGVNYESVSSDNEYSDYLKNNYDYPLFKLHGTFKKNINGVWQNRRSSIKATLKSIGRNSYEFFIHPSIKDVFSNIIKSHDLILIGYSGCDDFDICPLIANIQSDKNLIWINHNSNPSILKWKDFKNFPKDKNGDFIESRDEYLYNISKDSNINVIRKNQNVFFININTDKFIEFLIINYNLPPIKKLDTKNYIIDKQKYFEDWAKKFLCQKNIKYYLSARLFELLGRLELAIEYYNLCIEKNEDSILSLILTTNAYERLAFIHIQLSDYVKSKQILEIALSYSENKKLPEKIARIYHLFGMNSLETGDYEAAEKYYSEVFKIYKYLNLFKEQSDILFELGRVHIRLGNYDKSMDLLQQSYNLSAKSGDIHGMSLCLHEIGLTYEHMGDYKLSIENFQKSIEYKEKLGFTKGIATSYRQIGVVLQKINANQEAILFHNKSLELCDLVGDKSGVAANLFEIAIIYFEQSDYQNALKYQLMSLEMNEKLLNIGALGDNYVEIGTIFKDLNQFEKAKEYYEKGLEIISQTKDPLAEAICLYQIGLLNIEIEEFSLAKTYMNKSISILNKIGSPLVQTVISTLKTIR